MSREPALTYEGALRILGRKDHKWLARLDALLGGVILASGAVLLGAPAAAAPVLAAVFGLVDQKSEALKIVQSALDALPERLRGAAGSERRELIIAAHSTIVVAAYFEVLQEALGHKSYRSLEITKEETRLLVEKATRTLYGSEIPAPSASWGFHENLSRVAAWMGRLNLAVREFVTGLTAGPTISRTTADRATLRYESHFLRLSADVIEFRVWSELTEHAATRSALDHGTGVADILRGQSEALARLENILRNAHPAASTRPATDQRAILAAVNAAALTGQIVPDSAAQHYGRHITFPTVREIFVNPRYRFTRADPEFRLADETWWKELPSSDNLDLRLAAHIASAQAATHPLLILGHPGAGKSMLTRVLAARLPESAYTVVRVPLRHVSAHAPVYDQIQQALDQATHRRVEWSELVEQGLDTVRVVILDGLDELLQQAQSSLYGYLRTVQEFQRAELAQKRPVIVVVTSRTVVTDRVDVPEGSPVVKLEEFTDQQIERWLDTWKTVNAVGVDAGTFRALEPGLTHEQRALTAQPLLLMMMAIYVADPMVPLIDAKISSAELYRRLLTHFAEREASRSPVPLGPDEIREDVETQLRRLATAALGMFNRGRQDISAEDLGTDLTALEKLEGNVAELGHRVLGKFFFVYVAEARLSAPDSPQRRYEFLHATFGEYLVASLIVEELAEVARAAFSSRRRVREPEDDLLFALLSSESLSTRIPTLAFVKDICAELDETEREHMADVLTTLIIRHRDRHGSGKYQDYRPRPVDRVRELAAYTANLVQLRVAIHGEQRVPLAEIFNDVEDLERTWRSMLRLWQAGLDDESWRSILASLVNDEGCLRLVNGTVPLAPGDNSHVSALLADDRHMASTLRYGRAFTDHAFHVQPGDDWIEATGPWLAAALANWHPGGFQSIFMQIPEDAEEALLREFRDRIATLLKTRAKNTHISQAEFFVRMLMEQAEPDPVALACAVLAHPDLLKRVPKVARLLTSPAVELLFRATFEGAPAPPDFEKLYHGLRRRASLGKVEPRTLAAVRQLLDAYRVTTPDDTGSTHVMFKRLSWDERPAEPS